MSFFMGMLGGVVAHLALNLLSRMRSHNVIARLRMRLAARLAGPQCVVMRNELPAPAAIGSTEEPVNLS
jgi:hypothetical protein